MPYPSEASTVILFGSWFDEQSRAGMNSTITATPLPPTGATTPGAGYTPNLTDTASYAWLKTRTWTTTPLASGLYALPLTANDDPDLTAFGGWQITAQGENPFTVNISVTASTMTVTGRPHDRGRDPVEPGPAAPVGVPHERADLKSDRVGVGLIHGRRRFGSRPDVAVHLGQPHPGVR